MRWSPSKQRPGWLKRRKILGRGPGLGIWEEMSAKYGGGHREVQGSGGRWCAAAPYPQLADQVPGGSENSTNIVSGKSNLHPCLRNLGYEIEMAMLFFFYDRSFGTSLKHGFVAG